MPTEPRLVSLGRTGTGRCIIEFDATSLRFAVIGAGRLGASLALALQAKGPTLVGYTAATPSGRAKAQEVLGGSASASLADLVSLDPDLYFLTVPDTAVAEVAAQLAPVLGRAPGRWVIHTSGATSVDALKPCALAGADTLKLHPLQTFADPILGSARFKGAAIAVTPANSGMDSPEAPMGFALARLLEARPFLLADDDRTLYHAAATIACNYLVTLEYLAQELFVKAGLPKDEALSMFVPLVSGTLENLKNKGTTAALTGPLSRGDVDTIKDHLLALRDRAPELLPIYQQLGSATLAIVKARGDVDDVTVAKLIGLLTGPSGNHIYTPE